MGNLIGIEGYRALENIRLYRLALAVTLQREDFPPSGIYLDQIEILRVVQFAKFSRKIVVQAVEYLPERRIFPERVGFVQVEVMVGIADFDIKRCPFFLPWQKFQWVKHRTKTVYIAQVADAVVVAAYQ